VPTPTDALAVLGESNTISRVGPVPASSPWPQRWGFRSQALRPVLETACRAMLSAAEELTAHINGKPVYTLHEFKEGYQSGPSRCWSWGAGPPFRPPPPTADPMTVRVVAALAGGPMPSVPRWHAPPARWRFFADTEQKRVGAPEENFRYPSPALTACRQRCSKRSICCG